MGYFTVLFAVVRLSMFAVETSASGWFGLASDREAALKACAAQFGGPVTFYDSSQQPCWSQPTGVLLALRLSLSFCPSGTCIHYIAG